MSQKPTFSEGDFATCLAASVILIGKSEIPLDISFHQSLADALSNARPELEALVRLNFRIVPDPLHGDSETVRGMINAMVTRGLGHFDHPSYRAFYVDMNGEFARKIFEQYIPAIRPIMEHIAREAIEKCEPVYVRRA